jgi:xylulose-5-phosphate/fructose-6-phosphate phosphoketolase
MIYLQDNPLLKQPLKPKHIKSRLLGHWGSSPGLAFIYIHLNRPIKKYDLNTIFMAGPDMERQVSWGQSALKGLTLKFTRTRAKTKKACVHSPSSSRSQGHWSHCTPETAGSIHEGSEFSYVLSHACGAALDNPDLIVTAVVGDGESETGPIATSWHTSKFLNPIRDCAFLPILHLNGH